MDTPSVPSLYGREDSNKPIPKIFFDSRELNSKLPEPEKSPSFIQKIMSNAKSMLSARSLQPSICSEEPTRESDTCTRYIEFQGRVFQETSAMSAKTKPKYTPSDYCLVDEDTLSKQDTKDFSESQGYSNRTTSGHNTLTEENSNMNSISSREMQPNYNLPCGCVTPVRPSTPATTSIPTKLNGPFEASDFFVSLNDRNTNVVSSSRVDAAGRFRKNTADQPIKNGDEKRAKVDKKPFEFMDGWIRPCKNERNTVKKTDLNIPCRDEPHCKGRSSSATLPIIRSMSTENVALMSQEQDSYIVDQPGINNPCKEDTPSTSRADDEEDEEDIPAVFPRFQDNTSGNLPCQTCGLKRTAVSSPSPSPSIDEAVWPTESENVNTIFCENQIYPSKMIIYGDESNISNCVCGEGIFKPSGDLKQVTNFNSGSMDACPLKKINSNVTEKTSYGTPIGTRSCPGSTNEHFGISNVRSSGRSPFTAESKTGKDKFINNNDSNTMDRSRQQVSNSRDQDNQCAFVGSPILQASNFIVPSSCEPTPTNVPSTADSTNDKFRNMISDVSTKERDLHSQMKGIKSKEMEYDSMFNTLQSELTKYQQYVQNNDDDIENITKGLKNENKILKSEVLEMKLELKHTLDRVQGPMRLKLEAEKSRCEQLQGELQKTSQNMAMSQENYIKEMNHLKMQLCMACANMTELENVNKKLKEQMNVMDTLCTKLEDDLMQQKINEADTIRRLTTRKNLGDIREFSNNESIMVYNCESNLHDVARKLSKTIKECSPCSACASGLPAELKGAAKLIKDLTDMVESRKDTRSFDSFSPSRTDMWCQSPPCTDENSTQCMDRRNIGTVVSMCLISGTTPKKRCCCAANRYQATKTLCAGTKLGSNFNSQMNIKPSLQQQESHYMSAVSSPRPSGFSNSTGVTGTLISRSPLTRDSHTDPKMLDKQISSGHVHFEENTSDSRSLSPSTKDGLNDPMMVDKIVNSEEFQPPYEGALMLQERKNIVFAINTALITQTMKNDKQKDSNLSGSRPENSKQETSYDKNERDDGSKSVGSGPENSKEDINDVNLVKPCLENQSFIAGSRPEISDIDLEATYEQWLGFKPSTNSKIIVLEKDDTLDYKTMEGPWLDDRSGRLLPDAIINQGIPLCNKPSEYIVAVQSCHPSTNKICKETSCPKCGSANSKGGVTQDMSKPVKVCARPAKRKGSNGKVGTDQGKVSGVASTVTEAENFPFEVNTDAELLGEPPARLNITTCITGSGNLEVITEGPAGTIETVLNYKDDGTIEVITFLTELNSEASTATRTGGTPSLPGPKAASCHAISLDKVSAATGSRDSNRSKESRAQGSPAPFIPPCIKAAKSKSSSNVGSSCSCDAKATKSCGNVCSKLSKVTSKASAMLQVLDPRWARDFGTSTTRTNIDSGQDCAFANSHRTTSTQRVGQINATTSEATKRVSVTFETGKISMNDAVVCGGSSLPATQQTNPINMTQKSTGNEHTLATCSCLTVPITTSCKCEDTSLGAPDWKSDEEVSCTQDVCHQETCTDPASKKDAGSDPNYTKTQDQICMCDSEKSDDKQSKESSACETQEFGIQSTQPSDQSCQCNESKDVATSMTKEIVCGSPPCSTPCPVPCSPCSTGKLDVSNAGDAVNIEKFHSARNICECQNDETPKAAACDPCLCDKDLNCTCRKSEVPDSSICPCDEKPKKKKPGRPTVLECLCPGPCDCVICSPNAPNTHEQHDKDCNCSICKCPRGPDSKIKQNQKFEVYNVATTQKQSGKCTASCATGVEDTFGECTSSCATGVDEDFLGSTNLDCATLRAKMGSASSANRDARAGQYNRQASRSDTEGGRHPASCECVDCICMPRVRQLAMTREFPIIKDTKQVYQVTTNCQCPNTKKASKIPVASRPGSGKPKGPACNCVGPCDCTPCADPEKAQAPAAEKGKGPKGMTPEQLAELCDCGKCDCPVCAKKPTGANKKAVCCCTPDCVCDACKIEDMKKQIEKLRNEVKELKGISSEPDLGHPPGCDCGICNCPLPSGDDPRREQPDDCDCIICDCPMAPGKLGDMSDCTCEDCDCAKGPKFQTPTVKKPIDLTGCTCNPCKCPGGPLSAFPVCDCKICDCDPCSDPRKPRPIVCDCEPCECNPCGDPKRQAKKYGPQECTCAVCRCSGLKDDACTCVTCLCEEKAHPPDCTCDKCVCGDEHPPGCNCPICACGDKAVDHPPGCQCDKCICGGPPKPCPGVAEAAKQLDEFMKRTTSTHSPDCKCAQCQCAANAAGGAKMCTCSPCKCTECIFDSVKPSGHPPGCKCIICKCKDCDGGAGGAAGAVASGAATCKCTDCKCKPCKHQAGDKKERAKDCKCTVCNCTKCDIGGGDKKVTETKSAPALPKDRSCHCITCYCDSCNNPAKKGAGARPQIVIQGAGKKTVAAGPSATSVKKAPPPKPSGEHPQDCQCDKCLCKECLYGPKHGPNCKCSACVCKECGTGMPPEPAPAPKAAASATDCSCKPCACKECTKKGPEKKDAACHCATCQCKECALGGGKEDKKAVCHCATCECKECAAGGGKGSKSGGFEVPVAIPCQCKECTCQICNKGGGGQQKKSGGSSVGFEVPKRIECSCKQCNCAICSKQAGDSTTKCSGLTLRGGGLSTIFFGKETQPPPFEPPSRMPCVCNPCQCIMCNKQAGTKDGVISARPSTTTTSVQCKCPRDGKDDTVAPFSVPSKTISCACPVCSCPSCTSSLNFKDDNDLTPDCDCSLCRCAPCADPKVSKVSAQVGDAVSTHSAKVGISLDKQNRSTSCLCTPLRNAKTGESENRFGACDSVEVKMMNLSSMDNATLVKTIADNTEEKSQCKNQIQEITTALSSIKSACNEVEVKAMKTPLIKQASTFGQTMSGLKLALNNLQEKCKAKDLLIEAMTGELRNRTTSNQFLQVLDNSVSIDAPDYDKAADIVPRNYEEKKCKAMEGDKICRKKKNIKTCKCGRQHKDKDYKNVDLRGFEVVDIRRITEDSIIIKWKPPKSGPITGYDIFINGVNKSKVMSGGRTSAMLHCIDLSATIQITIYAVTKCGRCEPPAIAIYEIRN